MENFEGKTMKSFSVVFLENSLPYFFVCAKLNPKQTSEVGHSMCWELETFVGPIFLENEHHEVR